MKASQVPIALLIQNENDVLSWSLLANSKLGSVNRCFFHSFCPLNFPLKLFAVFVWVWICSFIRTFEHLVSLQISVMEKTVASRDKIVGQAYERLGQLQELLKNQARRIKFSRLVDDSLDLKSKVGKRIEISMSSIVDAVVSEVSASSNKVNQSSLSTCLRFCPWISCWSSTP